jgi:multiple sugar transport system ATP-binding protein
VGLSGVVQVLDPHADSPIRIVPALGFPKVSTVVGQAVQSVLLGKVADRIAVLDDGKLQQLGPPQDVYDKPANVFVAGFIGSPPMNLLRGSCRDGVVRAGEFAVRREGVPDGELLVGLRPESLEPAADGMPSLDFRVDVVEPLGDELIVHGSLAAELVNASGEDLGATAFAPTNGSQAEAVARLNPRDRPAEGSTIRLGVEPAEVHVFDARTGLAIR